MSTAITTVLSWPALALGAFFAAVTGYTLFADVLGGAPINTGHILSLAALVAAIASGHMAWPALRRGQIIPGLLLGVLFVAATFYVVVASGARNAETADTKAAIIAANNDARSRELKQLGRAEGMLAEAEQKLDRDCVKGRASKGACDGIRATIAVYGAAIRGHKATLKDLGPALAVNGGYAHAAEILVALGAATDARALEARLALVLPFVTVLIAEVGTIAFLHIGLGHGNRRPAPPATVGQPSEARKQRVTVPATDAGDDDQGPRPPRGGNRRPVVVRHVATIDAARADVIQLVQRGEPLPAQDALARRWGVHKGTTSKWLAKFETEGLVRRTVVGRRKTVAAA